MQWKNRYVIGALIGAGGIAAAVWRLGTTRFFLPVMIAAAVIGCIQPLIDFFLLRSKEKEREQQFLEFIRAVVESVKSGVSIPKSIQHAATKDYGSLTAYVRKLSNQISWGIPTRRALQTFADDASNPVIQRSVAIIIEAEQSGGDIRDILGSVVQSVVNIKKLKEERKAAVFGQVVQGYVVFYIFIGIMLFVQLWLFPRLSQVSLGGGGFGAGFAGSGTQPLELGSMFFALILMQGFFAGIMLGKFSEGTVKAGLLHSFIFMVSGALLLSVSGVV